MLILLKGEYMQSGLPKWDFPRVHLKCGIFTEDVGSIPKVGRSSGGGNANPHQYSCLARSLVGYSPWGCSQTWLSMHYVHAVKHFFFGGNFCWSCEASASHEKTVTTVKGVSAFFYMRRYKNWSHRTHKISSWDYLSEDPSCRFSWSTDCLISALHPELLAVLEVSSYSGTWFNPCGGRWQEPRASANLWLANPMGFD